MNTDCHRNEVIKQRRIAAFHRERQQRDLIPAHEVHKASIEAKLIGIASGRQLDNFMKCGHEEIYCSCKGCGHTEVFFYSCNRKWCPRCAVNLARVRASKLKLWAATIHQPKHLVLTMRNFPVLTGKKIRAFQKALLALRRRKLWAQVKGGCASLEITNGGDGWHLHAHLLLDVRWLDMNVLAVEWGNLVGQEFGIVKIKDVRGTDYLSEVSKYVAKGSELAKWEGEQMWEFICAIRGKRFFFAFGSLFKMSAEIKRELLIQKGERQPCDCGCRNFIYESEASAVVNQIRKEKRR